MENTEKTPNFRLVDLISSKAFPGKLLQEKTRGDFSLIFLQDQAKENKKQ